MSNSSISVLKPCPPSGHESRQADPLQVPLPTNPPHLPPHLHATLLGESPAMQRLRAQIARIAPYYRVALVTGETGTGKELVARTLHALSPAGQGPFIVCAAGTLSGALRKDVSGVRPPGHWPEGTRLLEAADGGTLYLDHVSETSPAIRARLVQILNLQRALRRTLGGRRRFDTRIVASSDRDLPTLTRTGQFPHDLLNQLGALQLSLPPLRSRREDIVLLAHFFLRRYVGLHQRSVTSIPDDTLALLRNHSWPGNVRELEDAISTAVMLSDGPNLQISPPGGPSALSPATPQHAQDELERLQDVVDRHVLAVLTRCSGNKLRAAERLGISRSTLYRMLDASASLRADRAA